MNKKSYFFISDAHLGSKIAENNNSEIKLIKFFEYITDKAKDLYILGDFFDLWFEYKYVIPSRYFNILFALKKLKEKNINIKYICGNHDFTNSKFLQNEIGMEFHFNDLRLDLYNKKIMLCHGNNMKKGTSDFLLKYILRNKFFQTLYKMIHPDIGIGFAYFISSLSRNSIEKKGYQPHVIKKYRDYAKYILDNNNIDTVIMGHTHYPDFQNFGTKTYINTGNWIKSSDYLEINENEVKLAKFNI